MEQQRKGVINAILAYGIWGLFPLYWKMLDHVDSVEILAGRVIWSFLFTGLFILVLGQWRNIQEDFRFLWRNKKQFWSLGVASFVIGLNWFVYIWSVSHDQVLQSSLGYYINPLISVVLGMVLFKEKLAHATIAAVLVAAAGVVILTINLGTVPYLALLMAISFAIYGALKKTIVLDAARGLVLETMFLLPIALGYTLYLLMTKQASFGSVNVTTDLLIIFSGVITAVPLVLFAKSAQRIPMYMLGFIQYMAPTLIFILGVFVYHEPFGKIDFIAFACIWLALLIFTAGKLLEVKKRKAVN